MKNDLVSIIIPLYNCEDRIVRCVKSVLCQTYNNIEVIVIDDGSTDNSLEILRNEIVDSRLRIFTQENHGVSYTRNRGIQIALSNGIPDGWIAFVDADDYIAPDTISGCLDHDESADMIACGFRHTDENDNEIDNFCDGSILYLNQNEAYSSYFVGRYDCKKTKGVWLARVAFALFRKAIIRDSRILFDESLKNGEDALFSLQYIGQSKCVKLVCKSYYTWWRRKLSLSRTNSKEDLIRFIAECETLWPCAFHLVKEKGISKLDSNFGCWVISYFNGFFNRMAKVNLSYSDMKVYMEKILIYPEIISFVVSQEYSDWLRKITQNLVRKRSYLIIYMIVKGIKILNHY